MHRASSASSRADLWASNCAPSRLPINRAFELLEQNDIEEINKLMRDFWQYSSNVSDAELALYLKFLAETCGGTAFHGAANCANTYEVIKYLHEKGVSYEYFNRAYIYDLHASVYMINNAVIPFKTIITLQYLHYYVRCGAIVPLRVLYEWQSNDAEQYIKRMESIKKIISSMQSDLYILTNDIAEYVGFDSVGVESIEDIKVELRKHVDVIKYEMSDDDVDDVDDALHWSVEEYYDEINENNPDWEDYAGQIY
jgi:hypothetical protein